MVSLDRLFIHSFFVDFMVSLFAVTAQTKAGNIPIGGIQFSVQTTFPGVNGFNHMATIPATPVVIGGGGGYEFAPTSGGSDFLR